MRVLLFVTIAAGAGCGGNTPAATTDGGPVDALGDCPAPALDAGPPPGPVPSGPSARATS
jgi:hypothetical protein